MAGQTEDIRSHAGPSLLALATVHTLLVAASIVSGVLLEHGATVVNPYWPRGRGAQILCRQSRRGTGFHFLFVWSFGAIRNLRGCILL